MHSVEDYACSQTGMQLLAANAMLISVVGEGVNNINSKLPNFLKTEFPDVPWREIVGMRNQIVHGYFDLNAEIVLETVKNDIPTIKPIIEKAIKLLENRIKQ